MGLPPCFLCRHRVSRSALSAASRLIPSASRTRGCFVSIRISRISSCASAPVPRPGPAAITSAQPSAFRNAEAAVSPCPQRASMASGTAVCRMIRFSSPQSTRTIPAPDRRTAEEARMAAPAIPGLPAARSTFPKVPLFPFGFLGGRDGGEPVRKVNAEGRLS